MSTAMFVGETVRVYGALTTWVGAEASEVDVASMDLAVTNDSQATVYEQAMDYDSDESRWVAQWDTTGVEPGTYRLQMTSVDLDGAISVDIRTVKLESVLLDRNTDENYFTRTRDIF